MATENPIGRNSERITHVRELMSRREFSGELPTVDPKHFEKEDRKAMFEVAYGAWRDTFSVHDVLRAIQPTTDVYEQNTRRASLKNLRKYGLIVKTGYLLFDDRHLAPVNHHTFIKDLGTLNDTFSLPDADNHRLQVVRNLQEYYPMGVSPFSDFKPASDESYHDAVDQHIANIRIGVREEPVLLSTFHTIRKSLRHMMNVYQLAGAIDPSDANVHIFQYLAELNKKLGDQHDVYVDAEYRGLLDYASSYTQIRPEQQDDLQRILVALSAA